MKPRSQDQSTPNRPRTFGLRRRGQDTAAWRHQLRQQWWRALEIYPLWTLLFLAVALWCLVPQRLFRIELAEVGTIATRNYVADRLLSVPNEAATREVQERAAERLLPVYDFDRSSEAERQRQVRELFAAGRELLRRQPLAARRAGGDDFLAQLEPSPHLKLSAEQLGFFLERGFSPELEERLLDAFSRILAQGVVGNKALLLENRTRGITLRELPSGGRTTQLDLYGYLDYPAQVVATIDQEVRSWSGLNGRTRRLVRDFVAANIAPNLTFNSNETLNLRQQAVAQVGTVLHQIRTGEVIVRQGDPIDDLAARAIALMAGNRDLGRLLFSLAGNLLLLVLAVVLLWRAFGEVKVPDRSRERRLSESLILLALHLAGARLAFVIVGALSTAIQREPASLFASVVYTIPLSALALLAVLLYGRPSAWVLGMVFSLLVGHISDGEAIWSTNLYSLAGSLAAVFALDPTHFKQRSALIQAGLWIGLVNAVAVLSIQTVPGHFEHGWTQLGLDLLAAFAGGLLAAAVTSFSVPICEALFGATTHIKLIELTNPNLPLLRRLALEAPGTFQHSLAVGNLAKAGCEAIDADPVLAHTGALYHDVGKLLRPRYFIENQQAGNNPHDKIQPSMSALILINHVKDGLELARQFHLPQPIQDAIAQHHGDRLIQFFYTKAKERSDPATDEVRSEDFQYPGPRPQSKEMGILLLADAVEAASRTLVEPNQQKIRGLVRTLFDDNFANGQLDATNLTLSDLRKVEEAFVRVLTNIYHRRIDYPGFDFNRQTTTGQKLLDTGSLWKDRQKAS